MSRWPTKGVRSQAACHNAGEGPHLSIGQHTKKGSSRDSMWPSFDGGSTFWCSLIRRPEHCKGQVRAWRVVRIHGVTSVLPEISSRPRWASQIACPWLAPMLPGRHRESPSCEVHPCSGRWAKTGRSDRSEAMCFTSGILLVWTNLCVRGPTFDGPSQGRASVVMLPEMQVN